MALIDSTYFRGELLITDKGAIATDLQQAIDQYEPEILKAALGYRIYKEVIKTGVDLVEPYKSLVQGAEFEIEINGELMLMKWEGLANTQKKSFIANYVYYNYMKRNYIQPSQVGTNQPIAKNTVMVSPYPKMVNAWNQMVEMYGMFPNSWFRDNRFLMTKPDGTQIYTDDPNLYNYMCANIDKFQDWIFTPIRTINEFGI